jgi:hypothetical protein
VPGTNHGSCTESDLRRPLSHVVACQGYGAAGYRLGRTRPYLIEGFIVLVVPVSELRPLPFACVLVYSGCFWSLGSFSFIVDFFGFFPAALSIVTLPLLGCS